MSTESLNALTCSFERELNRTAVNGRADDYLLNTTTRKHRRNLVFVTSIARSVCERVRIATRNSV